MAELHLGPSKKLIEDTVFIDTPTIILKQGLTKPIDLLWYNGVVYNI